MSYITRRFLWKTAPRFQDKTLARFYRDVSSWRDEGLHDINRYDFSSIQGLCINLERWLVRNHLRTVPTAEINMYRYKINRQFALAKLDRMFPFNGGDRAKFFTEPRPYENPERLAWIDVYSRIKGYPWQF